MANNQKKRISCLGVLLIFCMLLLIVSSVTVNLMFRNGNAPSLFGKRYCYYTQEDMNTRVPAGSLVFVEDAETVNTQDIVLYRTGDGEYRIAITSLIVDTDAEQGAKTYYLTTDTNTTAVLVAEEAIVGICTRRSAELGSLIGFMTSTVGIVCCMILPCVVLLLYVIVLLISGRNKKDNMDAAMDDEDNDIEFVKSIQKKQQKIAEMDAQRRAEQRRETQTFDEDFYQDENADSAGEEEEKPYKMLTDEEIAELEEEEAARRAERIAAVRTHMEQRRQTETPDGVPLYTTEIITKTHTLSLPKAGDKPMTTTQRPELQPTPTENIPRLTATGHLRIPTAEQIEAERKAREEKLSRTMEKPETVTKLVHNVPIAEDVLPAEKPVEEPERPAAAHEYVSALRQPVSPMPEQDAVPAAPAQEAAPAPAPQAAQVKKPAAKPAPKQKIASASFNDLMAFLDNEQKKL